MFPAIIDVYTSYQILTSIGYARQSGVVRLLVPTDDAKGSDSWLSILPDRLPPQIYGEPVAPSGSNQSGRSDGSRCRILSVVHDEVAACDSGGAIRSEESDALRDVPRNAHAT